MPRSRYGDALEVVGSLPSDLLRTRQRLGLVQREVAELTGISRMYVSHVERGRVASVSIVALLAVLRWLDEVNGPTDDPDVVRR